MADEEMLEIGLPTFAENALIVQREQAFERNEHKAEHQQLEHEVVEPGRKSARRPDCQGLHFGAAHQQRRGAKRQARKAVAIAARQHHRQCTERESAKDADLQHAAQQAQVRHVRRQRVLRDQQVGQQEAKLAEHAQHAEQARRDAGAFADGAAPLQAQRHARNPAFSGALSQPLAMQKCESNGAV